VPGEGALSETEARMVLRLASAAAQAELGVRLAAMHQALGNHAEALDALTASAAPGLP